MSEAPEQDQAEPDVSVRVAADVHRELLTIQYQRKMAGETLSMNEIIRRALAKAGAL